MFKEFKDFALKGNVLDLAIATVLGAAFNSIVSAVVDNVLMPFIGLLTGGIDFSKGLVYKVGAAELNFGIAIGASIKFIIVAIFLFLIIKTANKMKKAEEAAPAAPSSTDVLLQNILDELKKGK